MEILNFHRLMLIGALICFTLSCSEEPIENVEKPMTETNLEASSKPEKGNSRVVKDQYIVLLSKNPAKSDPRADAALEALTKEVGNMSNARVKNIYREVLTGFAAKLDVQQLEKIKRDKRVIAVYPDRYIELENTNYTDDPNTMNVQEYAVWGLDRLDQREKPLDRAYSYAGTGTGVTAYIMDSGIKFSHNEFDGRATLGIDLVRLYPDPTYDVDDPNVEDGGDCTGHGTHVSGTVGGETYGVAKDVNLVSVKVFSCRGRTTWARIIQAVEWITLNAVKPAVVNMSLGDVGVFEVVQTAIDNSINTGLNYVVSAGNDKIDACNYTPAYMPRVLTVGASTIHDDKANFSNYGSCLDVYAPGVDITSAGIQDNEATLTLQGTSMSAPHVTGIVALYLEKNPQATPAVVHDAVVKNSNPGVVTEDPAVNLLVHSIWEPVVFEPPAPPNLNLKVIGIDQKGSVQFYLLWDKTEDPGVAIYHNGYLKEKIPNIGEYGFSTKGKGQHSFMICELNYGNCSPVVSPDYSETDFVPNQPPTAALTYEVNDLEVTFFDQSTDSDGTIIKRILWFGDGYGIGTGNYTYTYREPGTYTVMFEVTDDHYQTDKIEMQVTVGNVTSPPEGFELTAVASKYRGEWQTELSWTPAGESAQIDVYRNGSLIGRVNNTGSYVDRTNMKGGGTLEYQVCEAYFSICSNTAVVQF